MRKSGSSACQTLMAPVRGTSSFLPLPLGSLSRKALSTVRNSSVVVGILRPSLSSQVLLIHIFWPYMQWKHSSICGRA